MSARSIPTTPPDVAAALLPIINGALSVGRAGVKRRDGDDIFVLVRADLQGHVTPITRYCRVGLTAFYRDAAGNDRYDLAATLCASAGRVLLDTRAPIIAGVEWQSGPLETTDAITNRPVAYSVVLLEVLAGIQ